MEDYVYKKTRTCPFVGELETRLSNKKCEICSQTAHFRGDIRETYLETNHDVDYPMEY